MVHSADPRHRGSRKIPRRGRGRDGSRPGEPAEPRWPDYDEPAGPGYHDPRRPGYEEPEYDGPGWPEPAAGPLIRLARPPAESRH